MRLNDDWETLQASWTPRTRVLRHLTAKETSHSMMTGAVKSEKNPSHFLSHYLAMFH